MDDLVIKILLTVLLVFFSFVHAEEQLDNAVPLEDMAYICSAEFSSGYDYKNGRWLRERFVPNDKFKVMRKDSVWSIYEFEIEYEHTDCGALVDNILRCTAGGEFIVDIKTMKFSVTQTAPYVHSTRRSRDSVVLTLGTCVVL